MKKAFTLAEVFSTHPTYQRKTAFTLAEVLITLGIIGVVAAMTLPSLIADYQKQKTAAHLKKVYTTLSQALKLSEAENGEYENWDTNFPTVIDYYNKYWYPYFTILKTCPTAASCGYTSDPAWVGMNGAGIGDLGATFSAIRLRQPFMLSDGTLISISIGVTNGDTIESSNILVDLNGSKGPNKAGKDFFIFTREKGKGILPFGYDIDNFETTNTCKRNGNGFNCAAKIMHDGWELKDNYPW